MKMIRRNAVELTMLMVLAILVAFAAASCSSATGAKVRATAPPPPGSQPPTQPFLDQWADFVALRSEIQDAQKKNDLQRKIDQLNGMATRMQSMVPQGYSWDEASLTFKPVLPPPPVKPAEPAQSVEPKK